MKKLFIRLSVYVSISILLVTSTHITIAATNDSVVAVAGGIGGLGALVSLFTQKIVAALATMFIAMGVAAFFFGVAKFIWGMREGVEKKVTEGKQFMGWGLVALFVMVSVWGIILAAQNIFGIQGKTDIVFPTFKFVDSSSNPTPNPNTTGLGTPTPNPNTTGLGTPTPNPNTTGITPNGGPTFYTCADGVTVYYNLSDRAIVCNNTQPQVFYCGDGTPYYDPSDYSVVCNGHSVPTP